MDRREAVERLVSYELPRLTPAARERLVGDWWTIDTDDPEYQELSEATRAELNERAEPEDPQDPRYTPLVQAGLRHQFLGVTNGYLQRRLEQIGVTGLTVEGTVEPLWPCPCCRYKTLSERGEYFICAVCFWEDDGSENESRHSGPNHMTLGEARANFARCGACTEGAKRFVAGDGPDRYLREERKE